MPSQTPRAPAPASPLNVREAAYALSVKEKTVNQAFDRSKLTYVRIGGRRPRKTPRTVRVPDLLAFALQEQASELLTFTKAGKSALKQQLQSAALKEPFAAVEAQIAALQALNTDATSGRALAQEATGRIRGILQALEVSIGPIRVAVGEILTPIVTSMAEVAASRSAVTCDPEIRGGEPVVSGTRIPVYMLAELRAQGVDDDVLLSDYPSLTPERLSQALLYAQLHPRAGRPRQSAAPWRGSAPIFELAPGAKRPTKAAKKAAKASAARRTSHLAVAR